MVLPEVDFDNFDDFKKDSEDPDFDCCYFKDI